MLQVIETSTTITITSPGVFEITFTNDTTSRGHISHWYDLKNDSGKTQNISDVASTPLPLLYCSGKVTASETLYYSNYDNNAEAELIWRLSNCVYVVTSGHMQSATGGTSTDYPFKIHYWIYADGRVYFKVEYINEGAEYSVTNAQTLYVNAAYEYDLRDYFTYQENETQNWGAEIGDATNIDACIILIITESGPENAMGNVSAGTQGFAINDYVNRTVSLNEVTWASGLLHIGLDASVLDPNTDGVIAAAEIAKYITPYTEYDFGTSDDPTVSTGSEVTDMNLPANVESTIRLGSGAFAAEMSSKQLEMSMNQDEELGPMVEIFDPVLQYGDPSSPTEPLIFHDKMDSITNNHSPAVGTGTVAVNGTPTLADASRDEGTLFTDNSDYFTISGSNLATDGFDKRKATITFEWIPDEDLNMATNADLFLIGDDDTSGDTFEFKMTYNVILLIQNNYTSHVNYVVNNAEAPFSKFYKGVVYHFHVAWDINSEYVGIFINGVRFVDNDSPSFTSAPSALDAHNLTVGGANDEQAKGVIRNFKIYDDVVLPYGGGPWLGNNEVNTNARDSKVLEYYDFETSTTNIGSKTVTFPDADGYLSTNFKMFGSQSFHRTDSSQSNGGRATFDAPVYENQDQGSVQFWFKRDTTINSTTWTTMFHMGDDENENFVRIRLYQSTGILYFGLTANDNAETCPDTGRPTVTDELWHHYKVRWRVGLMQFFLDGVLVGENTDGSTSFARAFDEVKICSDMAFPTYGAAGNMDHLIISEDFDMPDMWCVPQGGVLHLPEFKKDDTLKQMGDDYIMEFKPNGNILFRDFTPVNGS